MTLRQFILLIVLIHAAFMNIPLVHADNTPLTLEQLKQIAQKVQQLHFPNLTLNIQWRRIKSYPKNSAYFLQTNISTQTIFLSPTKRTYWIEYSPVLLLKPPSHAAIQAILTHEFFHLQDYASKKFLPLVSSLTSTLNKKKLYEYEHFTDLRAINCGEGNGLAEYRKWQLEFLSIPERIIKSKRYFTAQEIETIVNSIPSNHQETSH